MLERVIVCSGAGAQAAWTLAAGELGDGKGSGVHAGRLYFFHPYTPEPSRILVCGDASNWSDFREALRLLERSTDFDGAMVLGLSYFTPGPALVDVIPPVRLIWMNEAQSAHQRRCHAQELLAHLDHPSERLEALIRESL